MTPILVLIMLAIFTPLAFMVFVPLIGAAASPYVLGMILETLGIDPSGIAFITPAYWIGVILDSLRGILGF